MRHLTSLTKLVISSCMKLTSLGGLQALSSLEHLEVTECPSLTANTEEEVGPMPSSLIKLSFRIGGGDLGRLMPIYLQKLTSLSELEIHRCPQIRSLPSAGVVGHLTSLQKLTISDFKELTTLGGLQALSSLRELVVEACPNLTANSAEEDHDSMQNLTSLYKLDIIHCGRITSLQLLHHLTSLLLLRISDCKRLMSLRGLQTLVALKDLNIKDCPKLTVDLAEDESLLPSSLVSLEIVRSCDDLDRSLPIYLQNLTSLSWLWISSCPQVTSLPSEEVLKDLTSLRHLQIHFCDELTSLGGLQALTSLRYLSLAVCVNLQSLPADLRSLPSLHELSIRKCPGIKSLPKKGLPTSLRRLEITGCNPMLEERCREDRGADWTKIAHIPDILIRKRKL